MAEGEGLEPPQDHSRRFSRPLQYHYASPPFWKRITSVTAKMHKFCEKQYQSKKIFSSLPQSSIGIYDNNSNYDNKLQQSSSLGVLKENASQYSCEYTKDWNKIADNDEKTTPLILESETNQKSGNHYTQTDTGDYEFRTATSYRH